MKQHPSAAPPVRQHGEAFGKPIITSAANHVVICGQCVQRPESISPNQWMNFWERVIARELATD